MLGDDALNLGPWSLGGATRQKEEEANKKFYRQVFGLTAAAASATLQCVWPLQDGS